MINRVFENVISIELLSVIIKYKDTNVNKCGGSASSSTDCSGLSVTDWTGFGNCTLETHGCEIDISDILLSQPFLLLKIKEIDSNNISTETKEDDVFCRLEHFENFDTGGYYKFFSLNQFPIIKQFNPKRKISKMSIQLLKADGSIILCGNDGTSDTSQFIIDLNTAIEETEKTKYDGEHGIK